jgi:predicted ArsR family transcriptional regulator
MKNTKDSILNQVLLLQKATITQLSEKIGISEISVRQHLMNLESEGFVISEEERHGVGRPRFVYRLTEKGFQNAPTDYIKLTDQALTTMKRFLGTDTFLQLLEQIGKDLAEGYTSSLSSLTPDQTLEEVAKGLAQDGFIFSWTRSDEKYILTTHHCSFHYLGQKHPEVCTINHALLESLIQHPLNHDTCILYGDAACTYTCEVLNGK